MIHVLQISLAGALAFAGIFIVAALALGLSKWFR